MIKQVQRKQQSFAFQWFGIQSLGDLGEFLEKLAYLKPEITVLPGGQLRIRSPRAIDTESDLDGVQVTVQKNWWVVTEGGNFPIAVPREEYNRQFVDVPTPGEVAKALGRSGIQNATPGSDGFPYA